MNKFFKVLSPLIIATSLIGLASCGEEESFSFEANSIKEALTKLQTINDYTLNVDDTYQERSGKIYYTESRFYNELEGSGYIKSINGVFDCYLDNEDNLVGGEILLNDEGKAITNIYTNDLVKTFKVFDLSKIESNDPNSLVLIDNQSRNSFLSLLNVPYSALLEISSFEIIMKNNDLSTLTFDMQFNNETYINMTLENINSSKVDIVDNYIRSGGSYFTPNEDLIKIRNLFANDNYTREVYSGGTNPEYVGKEILTELAETKGYNIKNNYDDCGVLIFDKEKQDTHSGGSGCACIASVFSGYFYQMLKEKKINKILLIATGALMNSTSSGQGESIPGIAHAVAIENLDS